MFSKDKFELGYNDGEWFGRCMDFVIVFERMEDKFKDGLVQSVT